MVLSLDILLLVLGLPTRHLESHIKGMPFYDVCVRGMIWKPYFDFDVENSSLRLERNLRELQSTRDKHKISYQRNRQ